MLTPLYGFLVGDTLGVLVLVHDDEPVRIIAERLLQAASCRLAPKGPFEVVHRGMVLDGELCVARAGLSALERVDVRPVGSTGGTP